MARGVNRVTLLGRVGKDPEMRHTQSGTAVVGFSLATSEVWKDKSGNKNENTEWHSITAFGKLAEIIGQYVTKGMELYVEGSIKTEKWQDKSGNDRYTTKIMARDIQMLGGGNRQESRQSAPQNSAPDYPGTKEYDADLDDQIPF